MTLECMLRILAFLVPESQEYFMFSFFWAPTPNLGKLICQCLLKVEHGILITQERGIITCLGRLQFIDGWFRWAIRKLLNAFKIA